MLTPQNQAVHESNRRLLADFFAAAEAGPEGFKRVYADFLSGFDVPPEANYTEVDAGGVPAIWCDAPGSDPGKAIVHFHSGGYMLGSAHGYRGFGARLSAASGARVLLVDYRLAPEFCFPIPADDAIAALRWTIAELGHNRVAVSGDSAGGALTLVALQTLRDAGEPLPVAGLSFSPMADLAVTGASVTTNQDSDPLGAPGFLNDMAALYLNGADPLTPKASPLYGDFTELPPLLICASSTEMLLDDATRCASKAEHAGVEVTLHIGQNMVHIWPLYADRLPEAEATLKQAGAFAAEHLA